MTALEVPSFGLLIIGDEILSGKRADRHFAKVIALLNARGLQLSWAQYLPDDRMLLTQTLQRTFAQSVTGKEVVFSCGGIGATSDDHTRQAAAAALNLPLVLHPEAQVLISERCAQLAREGRGRAEMSLAENQRRLEMGMFPSGAQIIPNPYNQIPGFGINGHWFVPGFPVMAWPMIEHVLETHYGRWFYRNPCVERSVLLFDTLESTIAALMERIEIEHVGIKTFSLPSVGDGQDGAPARRHIELGVKGTPDGVEAAFKGLLEGLQKKGLVFELAQK